MELTELLTQLEGSWSGRNLLRLSWENPSDFPSDSTMVVAGAARGKFLTLAYTWSYQEKPQEGLLVVGYDKAEKLVTAAWGDSWHQSAKLLNCTGTLDENGVIDVRGSYPAPEGPDWGWRILVKPQDAQRLQLLMYNCPPDGSPEDLAVQADYTRA